MRSGMTHHLVRESVVCRTCCTRAGCIRGWALFAHGVGERDQVILIRVGRQWARMAHELPPARGGNSASVTNTQVPGVWFPRGSERTYYRSRVRVDERQRGHCIVRTPGPAAATGYVHEAKAIVRKRRRRGGHAHPL
ncbi:hypothetical protein MMRN_13440 [Mycobacterium marinum]|uniref:Uncharacterized protein n=1 Tax=Mycobacterium shottsii TaxID=133549 RepID=A0A7I7LKX3_9MYCO|nr:hypothetical protein MMRN_13440 [Mycobacterium marinum]BBX60681.1 hypothetical protein MSHO_60260 [Mycobacterium shottsii]GJO01410.1 hypothetical protein NJB1808e29_23760 [Mycobacterium marinum]GJO50492.1 hypothetical protein NJB1604_36780 [Mycobacterium marinum]GJP11368.1 hypothetical protein NJB18001_43280 [Mycobacterium marinum]